MSGLGYDLSGFDERLILPEHVGGDVLREEHGLSLEGELGHHLTRVLRLREQDQIRVGDGLGSTRLASLTSITRGKVTLSWAGAVETTAKADPEVVLVLSGLQGKDLDAAVVAAVEAGANQIWVIPSERSQRSSLVPESATWLRLQRLIRTASAQSGRLWIPQLHARRDVQEALDNLDWCCFTDQAGAVELTWKLDKGQGRTVGVLVGPEGGWTEAERSIFAEGGLPCLWLGPGVLRARTAAPVAVHRLIVLRAKDLRGQR